MRDKIVSISLSEQEAEQLNKSAMQYLIDGKCKNRSDYIRQALAAYASNGNTPPKTPTEIPTNDANQESKQEPDQPTNPLTAAFADIDI